MLKLAVSELKQDDGDAGKGLLHEMGDLLAEYGCDTTELDHDTDTDTYESVDLTVHAAADRGPAHAAPRAKSRRPPCRRQD